MAWLVVFGAALHYGLAVGRIYLRYARFDDALRTAAASASERSDEAIRASLLRTIDSLALPAEARQLWIHRSGAPNRIQLEAWYDERLTFPFGRFVDLTFHPKAEHRF